MLVNLKPQLQYISSIDPYSESQFKFLTRFWVGWAAWPLFGGRLGIWSIGKGLKFLLSSKTGVIANKKAEEKNKKVGSLKD